METTRQYRAENAPLTSFGFGIRRQNRQPAPRQAKVPGGEGECRDSPVLLCFRVAGPRKPGLVPLWPVPMGNRSALLRKPRCRKGPPVCSLFRPPPGISPGAGGRGTEGETACPTALSSLPHGQDLGGTVCGHPSLPLFPRQSGKVSLQVSFRASLAEGAPGPEPGDRFTGGTGWINCTPGHRLPPKDGHSGFPARNRFVPYSGGCQMIGRRRRENSSRRGGGNSRTGAALSCPQPRPRDCPDGGGDRGTDRLPGIPRTGRHRCVLRR